MWLSTVDQNKCHFWDWALRIGMSTAEQSWTIIYKLHTLRLLISTAERVIQITSGCAAHYYVEINRVQIEILNWLSYKSDCLKSKEREKDRQIYGKGESILGEAEYHIRRPMPGITTGASPTPQHGGWWRPMGAASHRPHARSLRPNATKATGSNPVPTYYVKSSGLGFPSARVFSFGSHIQTIAAQEMSRKQKPKRNSKRSINQGAASGE